MGLNKTKEKIKTWIEALESGNYKQTRNYMYDSLDGPSYCCLGVLAQTLGENVKNLSKEEQHYALCAKTLTHTIVGSCIHANDTFEMSFEDIALSLRGYYKIWN